jgi:predicted RNase H-like nuclease (RuvC/YqgF family)
MTVKRYDYELDEGIWEDDEGIYVTYEDYERDINEYAEVNDSLSAMIERQAVEIHKLRAEIERLKAERLEIAEKAYKEGYVHSQDSVSEWVYNAADAEWFRSDIRKELTND